MNRNTLLLFFAVIILAAGYWLISKKPWNTAPKMADEFAVKDTASVSKIFMANKNGIKILLERQSDNTWRVNNKDIVDEIKIKLLLGTLHDMQIQHPIQASMRTTAIGMLASTGIKTEIYAGEKCIKTIYVGGETPERTGTFMVLEGSEDVYSIHIPGFVGYLTPRFILNEIKWITKFVFNEDHNTIVNLKVHYPSKPRASFVYNQDIFKSTGSLKNNEGNLVRADTQMVKFYLSGYKNLYVEGYYDDFVFLPNERDSLHKRTPFCEIELSNQSGQTQYLTVYDKPLGERSRQQFDEKGNLLKIDPEKYFAVVNKRKNIASIQEYNFGRLFKELPDLMKK
ncbi:MAG: hypothetical protein Q8M15_01215 [Bacteroidota bacterium]|nr:hypothetical protein [Bacteroidota bacterium]